MHSKPIYGNSVRSTVTDRDDKEVMIRIPLMTQVFEVVMKKSTGFPEEAPNFSGIFTEGFNSYEWNSQSTLWELAESVTDFLTTIDAAILEIKEVDIDGFQIISLEIDEEENGHLLVRLKSFKYNETLTISLNVEDFRGFPRFLRCSNPSRMASFDCEKWIAEDKLGTNLRRIYGELEAAPLSEKQFDNKSKDSLEEVEEIMDFI